ncbi:hypothetical protein LMG23994_01792 [Cupriavidus pinatubonensis]|uniref:Uncharacterized protein n=2 Tax=Cupriavidus pinatubonensis TaxID=248026 RepID=A0ABM8WRG4_9BURK|nr:hypothetical protein LMG23994_01792 [Cupriavidus pinatubonensis]
MTIYVKQDGLWQLDAQHEQAALRAGCVGLKFGEKLGDVAGNILLAHSTVGWIGVYRIQPRGNLPVRIKRFQDFERALHYAKREDRV